MTATASQERPTRRTQGGKERLIRRKERKARYEQNLNMRTEGQEWPTLITRRRGQV
jgi:hypothetical protein